MPYGKISLHSVLSKVRRSLQIDKRLLTFGFFLLISAMLWTLKRFSYSYTYELPAQIELVTPNSENYVVSTRSITDVLLRVRARGHDLVRYKLFSSKKFKVAVTPTNHTINNTSSVTTAQLRNAVAQQLGTNYELQVILPDSITFQISRIAVKKVPVRSNFSISCAPQYMQQGATQFVPDSVIISGAENAIQGINEIYTEQLTKDRLSDKQSGKVDLIAPPQVFLSHQKILYNIDIQRFTEVSYELPIHILGVPETLSVSVLPATAKVAFSVTMEKFPQLKHEELYLTVNYGELSQSISDQLRVQLSNPPDYVLSTSITPSFVNIISMNK